jgi:hypothetical protein
MGIIAQVSEHALVHSMADAECHCQLTIGDHTNQTIIWRCSPCAGDPAGHALDVKLGKHAKVEL